MSSTTVKDPDHIDMYEEKDASPRSCGGRRVHKLSVFMTAIALTAVQLAAFVLLNLFRVHDIVALCVNMFLCLFMVWFHKNISGRYIVRLRWWSGVFIAHENVDKPEKRERICEHDAADVSCLERGIFALCLLLPLIVYILAIVGAFLSVVDIARLPEYIMYALASLINPIGYLACWAKTLHAGK